MGCVERARCTMCLAGFCCVGAVDRRRLMACKPVDGFLHRAQPVSHLSPRRQMRQMKLRPAEAVEIDRLATIWHDGWQDAHARILPVELARVRTLESFRDRLQAALADVTVAEVGGEPAGFCIVKGDELYQLFVSSFARGTGIAAALVADAEARLRESGVATAWLACAIGNDRAARFYEKCGWHRTGTVTSLLDTPTGVFHLDVWRYEKHLRARSAGSYGWFVVNVPSASADSAAAMEVRRWNAAVPAVRWEAAASRRRLDRVLVGGRRPLSESPCVGTSRRHCVV